MAATSLFLSLIFYLSLSAFADRPNVDKVPFLMPDVQPKEPDSYFCSAVELDPKRTYYIVGFEANATAATAHHILLYGCSEPGNYEDDVWDCGEMVRESRSSKMNSGPVCSKGSQVIYAWAFDAPKLILPEGVGFKIGRDSPIKYLVLQVHYASVWRFTQKKETDNSGLVLSITSQKMPKTAGVLLLGTNGRIRAHSTENMETACRISENVKMHPFAFRTHTHSLGQAVSGYLVQRKGVFSHQWELLGKKNPQDPQMFYPVENPKSIIKKNDIVAARCTMMNDRDQVTRIGPTSKDEMCNFYLMYWVDGDKLLKQKYCFSWGPPLFYWKRVPLFNIPDKDASTV